jgi:hypothetical protein
MIVAVTPGIFGAVSVWVPGCTSMVSHVSGGAKRATPSYV